MTRPTLDKNSKWTGCSRRNLLHIPMLRQFPREILRLPATPEAFPEKQKEVLPTWVYTCRDNKFLLPQALQMPQFLSPCHLLPAFPLPPAGPPLKTVRLPQQVRPFPPPERCMAA